MAASRLRPTEAIHAALRHGAETQESASDNQMVRRDVLIAKATFLTCGLLLQTVERYSAAENTKACVEIRSVFT